MISPDTKSITVLSVSFYSSFHLKHLFTNLVEKADHPENIQFLIVDNTNGKDNGLKESLQDVIDLTIINNDGRIRQRSKSHASALDLGLKNVETEFTLIVDPDIHVFKSGWDTFCLNPLSKNEKSVLGASYPIWKLGKVHDYPSVVFMFFKTGLVQASGNTFYPFPSTPGRIWNSVIRKIVRLGGIASKNRLDHFRFLRTFCGWLENLTGITSPDTGKEIIELFRSTGFQSIVFDTPYSRDLLEIGRDNFAAIAREFELYIHENEPILTHMYSSGVFHWKTFKGSDFKYWQQLINKVETVLSTYKKKKHTK